MRGRERRRQVYLALLLLCFPLASIYSFSKECTCLIYPFATLHCHLGAITWSFTHCTVICGDWFSRPIIFTSKIWSVCPCCYWATLGYKISLVVSPWSTVVWISYVPSYTRGILPFFLILAMKMICQCLGSDQEGIFKWLLGKDIQISHRLWFTFQPRCIVLSMLICLLLICIDLGNKAVQQLLHGKKVTCWCVLQYGRIVLNAQVSLLARLAISLHSLHSFLFTAIYTVFSLHMKEK